MRKIILAFVVLAAALVSSCNETVVPQPKQTESFSGRQYVLNVASIDVVDDYRSSRTLPHVEGLSDITPSEAVRKWVSQRLASGGRSGRAEVVISNASILRRELPKQTSGVEGYFTTEQTEEYKGALQVEIKIYDDRNILPVGTMSVSSKDLRTLSEKATDTDRKNLYHDMSVELIRLLEPEIDRNMRTHLNNYLL